MRVKMIATRRGCEDGFTVKKYFNNVEYEIRDNLAYAFLAAGFAIPVGKINLVKRRNNKNDT